MKRFLPVLLLFPALCSGAQGRPEALPLVNSSQMIRDSSEPNKRREPEMNASEQALYQKVAPILARKPAFAVKLLKAMSAEFDNSTSKAGPAFEFMMANSLYMAGQGQEAEQKYRSVVEQSPDFVRAWNNLGVLYYTQDRFNEAAPCFSKSLALGDRDPMTFCLLGNCFEKQGNTVSAEMAYMQALALEPEKIECTEGLLRLQLAEKQYPKAEKLVKSLLREKPREAKYWLTYVNLLLSAGRSAEALALLQRMEDEGLASAEDEVLLADLCAEQRLVPEALRYYRKVAAAQPLLVEQKLLQLTKNLILEKTWDRVVSVQQELARHPLSSKGRLDYQQSRVDLEIARNNWTGAKTELELLLREAPTDGKAWLSLGRVYLADVETPKAVEAFEKARGFPESAGRANVELANIELKNRRYAQCLAFLDQALQLERTPALENFRNQIRSLVTPEKRSTP